MSSFVQKVTEYHLSTWFILPLIQLNKFSFGAANFQNAYVNAAGTVITVEVADLRLCSSFVQHQEYIKERTTEVFSYIYFKLPERWKSDFELFRTGKYSKFSDEAKEMIIVHSGLKYKHVDEAGETTTDARLMALDRNPTLREKWENELSVSMTKYKSYAHISEDMELLSIPSKDTYKELE